MTDTETPRIYVACLKSYNEGNLIGRWIDATDVDHIQEEIEELLSKSGGEEWAIHDYENFGGLSISEYQDLEKVAELGELIEEHGEAFAVFADHEGVEFATVQRFEDSYCGEWESETDYAENLFDELYTVPDYLVGYIDYEKYARDLFIDSNWSGIGPSGQLYVFNRI